MNHHSLADFSSQPAAARVSANLISYVCFGIIAFCLARRSINIRRWRKVLMPTWFILSVYIDSLLFIITTGVVDSSFSLGSSYKLCDVDTMLCIVFYFSSKIFLYLFYVEKVRIVRNPLTPRILDKLYLFNTIFVLGVYVVFASLAIVYRYTHITQKNECLIGIGRETLIPAAIYDTCVNSFLTYLFIRPVTSLISFGNGNPALRAMTIRTGIGSALTTAVTIVNVIVITVLNGELHWLCIMLCNCDVTFSVIVLQWVSSPDRRTAPGSSASPSDSRQSSAPMVSAPQFQHPDELPDFEIAEAKTAVLTERMSSEPGRSQVDHEMEKRTPHLTDDPVT